MDAYEVLISAALIGDTAHFAREDEVEAAWTIVDPVLRTDSGAAASTCPAAGARRRRRI